MSLAGATISSLVTLMVPPSAVLLGYLFLAEKRELTKVAGMVFIGLGLLAINNFIRFPLKGNPDSATFIFIIISWACRQNFKKHISAAIASQLPGS